MSNPLNLVELNLRKAIEQYVTEQITDAINTASEETILPLVVAVSNLNAWATALATKLNADDGVADTNYDTDPQA